MFHKESYALHGNWYENQFPGDLEKQKYYQQMRPENRDVLANWLQYQFFKCLNPVLGKESQTWLTIGDAYGLDARYILSKNNVAVASDLTDGMLKVAKAQQIIKEYSCQNAENLTYDDASFDYLLCKESYHHFPRPYAALYEMIRVCRKGLVIIEPQDPISKMPVLLALQNILSTFGMKSAKSVWKNRFSFEPVGNFVYKLSERELEKFAAGLALPIVAHKHINPNFYFKGSEVIGLKAWKSRCIRFKKGILDLLVYCRLIPGQVLSSIIFKEKPEAEMLTKLKKQGYRIVEIPENPFRNV